MNRIILVWVAIATGLLSPVDGRAQQVFELHGTPTNGLEPDFLVQKCGTNSGDWYIGIDLLAQTNFDAHTWLKPLDPTCVKLQLMQTNGTEIKSTKDTATAVTPTIKVSDILDRVPRRWRASQWWPGGQQGANAGGYFGLSAFTLQSRFDFYFTNDVILKVTTFLYKADTNQVTARLVEFPATKLKLQADGRVQKME